MGAVEGIALNNGLLNIFEFMKKLLPILFALFSLVFFARAQTANVLVSLQDFVSTPQIYQAVTMTPLAPYGLNGSTIAIPNARTFLTGTNSSVTFSNTLMGYTYKLLRLIEESQDDA